MEPWKPMAVHELRKREKERRSLIIDNKRTTGIRLRDEI